MLDKSLHIVLFGATGFTGGLVAEYLARAASEGGLRWAIAGRNREKLDAVRTRLSGSAHIVPELILADSEDPGSLREMAARTRVVITTVGPYEKYGEALVKACAEVGTDYVDLTGEPGFVERMIERYDHVARASGAKIVHACGFDSIPHDLGVYFTLKALMRRLAPEQRRSAAVKIEGFVRANGSFSGGTWHSAVTAMGNARKDEAERRRRAASRQRDAGKGGRRVRAAALRIRRSSELGYWALPLPTIDPQIVLRSARALEEYGRDFEYGHYAALRSVTQVAALTAGAGVVFALAQLHTTRELLLRVREPGSGPTRETIARGWFTVTFVGQSEGQRVVCEVRGGDPGYGDTAKMLAEAALCLAFDRGRLPQSSGVLTSVVAFGEQLFGRLEAAGIRFAEVRASMR